MKLTESSQIVLWLLLRKFGVFPLKVRDELYHAYLARAQYTIYFCQCYGHILGYHYEWIKDRPISQELGSDYWKLIEGLMASHNRPQKELNGKLNRKLSQLNKLLTIPLVPNLEISDSLFLLAMVHFLQYQGHYPVKQIRSQIKKLHPELAIYTNKALRLIKQYPKLAVEY